MKRLLPFLILLAATPVFGQVIVGNYPFTTVSSPPTGACSSGSGAQMVMGTGTIYTCQNGVWGQSSRAGSPVTIVAGAALVSGSVICDTADGFTCNEHRGVVTMVVTTSSTGILFTATWTMAWPSIAACTYSNYAPTILAANTEYFSNTTTSVGVATVSAIAAGTYKIGYQCT
jgi:hypothetical protein